MEGKKKKKKNRNNIRDDDFIKKAARLLKGETLDKNDKYTYDLYRKKKVRYTRLGIDVWNKNDLWSIDLAEMKDLARYNDNLRYLLCVVDVYSRYAFVKLLKNKTSRNVGKKFEEILVENGEVPKKIVSDEGTEFQDLRHRLSKQYGFKVYHTYNREIKATHAERFIRTLKVMIRRTIDLVQNKRNKQDYRYKEYIDLIVERYNESPHQGLLDYKLTPYKVYIEGVKVNNIKRIVKILNRNPKIVKDILKENDKVLIARVKNNIFEKSSLRQWRNEVFVINKVLLTDPITYKLRESNGDGEEIKGTFYREELRKV